MTIVDNIAWHSGIAFTALEPDFIDKIYERVPADDYRRKSLIPVVFKLLEIFLRVTAQQLCLSDVITDRFKVISIHFVGALHSDRFATASFKSRVTYHQTWKHMLCLLEAEYDVQIDIPAPTEVKFWTWKLCECVKTFNGLALNAQAIRDLTIWIVANANGELRQLHLAKLRDTLGQLFADSYYEVADTYFSGSAGTAVDHINRIADFLAEYPGVTAESLNDELFSISLWENFIRKYISDRIETARIDVITIAWTHDAVDFLFNHLFQSGLATKPSSFPSLPRKKLTKHPRNIFEGENGILYFSKLLTLIPLELTDDEAVQILFKQIRESIRLIDLWAETKRTKIYASYQQRKKWELTGDSRHVLFGNPKLTARENPQRLENISAMLAYWGGYTTREENSSIATFFDSDLKIIARQLGFPTSESLLPFAAILVHEHPDIGQSSLEQLEIFDENHKLTEYFQDDSGWILRCYKKRKGVVYAEKEVPLTPRAKKVIDEILEITDAPRQYMRKHNIPGWRHLFITTGSGFGVPKKLGDFSTDTSDPLRVQNLEREFIDFCRLSAEQAKTLGKTFSLPALRSSLGVLEYIETCSGQRMSDKLGHESYEYRLISHYLPDAIRTFFRTRYVRIMQTGIVVEAMKGSPYLLRASGFSTMAELNRFLNAHVLQFARNRPIKQGLILGDRIQSSEEVEFNRIVFTVSVEVLTVYASIEAAIRQTDREPSGIANYWRAIGGRLISYIEEKRDAEPEHGIMLDTARRQANPKLVEATLYD